MIYESIKNSIIDLWPTLIIIIVMLVCVRLAYLLTNKASFQFHEEFWKLAGIIYIILFYYLVTTVDVNTKGGMNLIPFTEITRYSFKSSLFIYNVIGNILLFVPLGYMISTYVKPKKGITPMFVALIISATIECVQLRIGRSFDVDDIILNTLGALVGYILYLAASTIKKHLPNFVRSNWFNNIICIIISLVIVWYGLKIMGVNIPL